jgi:hypothetical protein
MPVLIPNCQLVAHARKHPLEERDAHGVPVPTSADEVEYRGPYPSRADETEEGWKLSLDPATYPLRAGDLVTEDGGTRSWTLAADPITHFVPGYPQADFVEARATLNPPRVN